jgi:Flp pilus assembly protein TadD
MDKRRLVISAFLLATLLLGFGLQKLATNGPQAASIAVDPHAASGDLSGESRLVHQQFQQAVALLKQGQFEYAVQGFHEVLKLVPDLPEAHVNMGFALLGLEKFKAAQEFFDSASNIRPSQSNAYYGLAVALEGLGDSQQAVITMRTFVHIAEQNDPFRRKAESAIWEWEATLAVQKNDE